MSSTFNKKAIHEHWNVAVIHYWYNIILEGDFELYTWTAFVWA